MILDRVTFTGADDSVDPLELVEISAAFPFVEWGILFSLSHQGQPRYPSRPWIDRLADAATPGMNFSAHLCGRWAREMVVEADNTWGVAYETSLFRRIQINFHGRYHHRHPHFIFLLEAHFEKQFILQCDGVNDHWVKEAAEKSLCVPLFDTSGGKGLLPKTWPKPWKGVYCGYAGGLGPQNVTEQLEIIRNLGGNQHFWIDMERRVRSADDAVFDLSKVRAVLEKVKAA